VSDYRYSTILYYFIPFALSTFTKRLNMWIGPKWFIRINIMFNLIAIMFSGFA